MGRMVVALMIELDELNGSIVFVQSVETAFITWELRY
jgi:hypothetical protein